MSDGLIAKALDQLVRPDLAARIDRVAHGINPYGFDKWGFSPAHAKRALALTELVYRRYFRVEAHGLDKVPKGRGLLIGNHSAQLAYDGMMVAAAFLLDADPPRHVRAMIEKFFQSTAVVNVFMARSGQLTGLPDNCERLLSEDELLLVFPEGARGGGKLYKDRYKLFDFGTGFMRLALKTRSPITPFAFIGGEEACPSFYDVKPLAKMLGLPYLPVTPTVLPLPLPAKCSLWIGDPLFFEGNGDEEDHDVIDKVEVVKAAVAALIERGLSARKGVFL